MYIAAFAFIFSFVVICQFIVLSIFIAIVLVNFTDQVLEENLILREIVTN